MLPRLAGHRRRRAGVGQLLVQDVTAQPVERTLCGGHLGLGCLRLVGQPVQAGPQPCLAGVQVGCFGVEPGQQLAPPRHLLEQMLPVAVQPTPLRFERCGRRLLLPPLHFEAGRLGPHLLLGSLRAGQPCFELPAVGHGRCHAAGQIAPLPLAGQHLAVDLVPALSASQRAARPQQLSRQRHNLNPPANRSKTRRAALSSRTTTVRPSSISTAGARRASAPTRSAATPTTAPFKS